MTFENGDKYKGEWRLGEPHGKGSMLHKFGLRYDVSK
jgi:hypothetical protein